MDQREAILREIRRCENSLADVIKKTRVQRERVEDAQRAERAARETDDLLVSQQRRGNELIAVVRNIKGMRTIGARVASQMQPLMLGDQFALIKRENSKAIDRIGREVASAQRSVAQLETQRRQLEARIDQLYEQLKNVTLQMQAGGGK